jgi:hypothetical protein
MSTPTGKPVIFVSYAPADEQPYAPQLSMTGQIDVRDIVTTQRAD